MSDFVNTIDSIGDEALTNSIIDRSITEIKDNYVTRIGTYAFKLCTKLTTVNFPKVTSIGNYAFDNCTALTSVSFPAATMIANYAFRYCSALTTADFPAKATIGSYAFQSCSTLKTLILRSETMATLSSTNAFSGTPIASGTGYIYVPASLVDSYKAATNWSTYANQIRAIEDYPEVCDPYSWEAVAKHIELGDYATFYKVGDGVPLDLGSEGVVNMQIAAFDADDLADGSGKAPISWISKELLSTTRHMNPSDSGVKGGWETCEMRTYLQTTIKPLISGNIAKIIVPVTKQHEAYSASGSYIANQITTDELWIPSKPEVYGGSRLYLGLFNNVEERTKYLAGGTTPTAWWLRSTDSSSRFDYVGTNGSIYGAEVQTKYGVCLGFCT